LGESQCLLEFREPQRQSTLNLTHSAHLNRPDALLSVPTPSPPRRALCLAARGSFSYSCTAPWDRVPPACSCNAHNNLHTFTPFPFFLHSFPQTTAYLLSLKLKLYILHYQNSQNPAHLISPHLGCSVAYYISHATMLYSLHQMLQYYIA